MASESSPPPPPPPEPLPPSEYDASAAEAASSPSPMIDVSHNNEVRDPSDEIPGLAHFEVLDSKDYIEKYQKYELEYTRRLLAKYFSDKNIYGDNIFEEKTMIDDETIMSSRCPCTQSFADPMQCFQDRDTNGSATADESPSKALNGELELENDG